MKNRQSICIILLFLIFTLNAKAQNLLIGAGSGLATFSMSSSKEYNQMVINTLAFNPAVTDNFPPYLFFNAEALYSFPKTLAAGLAVSRTSTGSRLHLADYSGEYTFDNLQNVLNVGAKILVGKQPGKTDGINIIFEGGMALSKMTFDESITLDAGSETYNEDFSAEGFYFQPGVAYHYHFLKQFQVAAHVSWYIGIEKGYHEKGNSNATIQFGENKEVIKPEWNGFRAGLTLYWNTGNITTK
jgi:hypothetical protein